MKDFTEGQLEGDLPPVDPLQAIEFCLKRLYSDRLHYMGQSIAIGLTYEELVGALLLARAELQGIDRKVN